MTPPKLPEVVVTGDDLGLRADWDAAIFEALELGTITSTSVVTNGPTFAAAAEILRERDLDCGIHLNLLHGRPLSPASASASLVDHRGEFPGSVGRVLQGYATGQLRSGEVAQEWERQLEHAIASGLRPSHLNGHFHLHLLPGLFSIARDLACRFGVPWMRLPDEPPGLATGLTARVRGAALRWLSRRERARHPQNRPALISCRGVGFSGGFDERAWTILLQQLPSAEAPIEVMCHPGQTGGESAALRSPKLREQLQTSCRLRRFRDLTPPEELSRP